MRFKPNFEKTVEKAKKEVEKSGGGDPRFWWPTGDKKKEMLYKFRFLPSKPQGNEYGDLCFEKIIYHDFEYIDSKGKKRFWNKPCNKMVGQVCPICDKVSELWDKEKDPHQSFTVEDEALRDLMKLKMRYVTNIHIIEDPAEPDNDGKTFLTKFPAKGRNLLFEKVLKHINPSEIDMKKDSFIEFNPYDPLNAPNFEYHYSPPPKNEKYGSYDGSAFGTKLYPISKKDEEMEEIILSAFDLEEYVKEWCDEYMVTYDATLEEIGHYLDGNHGTIEIKNEDISDDELYNDEVDNEDDVQEESSEEKEVEIKEDDEDEPPFEVKETKKEDKDDVFDDWDDED